MEGRRAWGNNDRHGSQERSSSQSVDKFSAAFNKKYSKGPSSNNYNNNSSNNDNNTSGPVSGAPATSPAPPAPSYNHMGSYRPPESRPAPDAVVDIAGFTSNSMTMGNVVFKAPKSKQDKSKKQVSKTKSDYREAMSKLNKATINDSNDSDLTNAKEIVALGLKGKDLVDHLEKNDCKITGASLAQAVLDQLTDKASYSWVAPNEYGLALTYLCKSNKFKEAAVLAVIQKHCFSLNYPLVPSKTNRPLLDAYFVLLWNFELFQFSSFEHWCEIEDDEHDKLTAISQTTDFIARTRDEIAKALLEELDNEENEEK